MGGHRRLDRHDRHGTGQCIHAATTIRFDDPAEPPATRQQSVRDQPSLAARYELPAPASSNSSGSWGCMTGGRQGGCASFSLGPQQQSRRQRDLMGRRSDIHPAQPCGSVVHPIRQRASRPASQPARHAPTDRDCYTSSAIRGGTERILAPALSSGASSEPANEAPPPWPREMRPANQSTPRRRENRWTSRGP